MITQESSDVPFLHFLMKNPRQQDLKLTLKNKSDRAIVVDFICLKSDEIEDIYDINVNPPSISYQPNMLATAMLSIKRHPINF